MTDKTSLVVIGLGYVGLPLVIAACSSGLHVTGLDTSVSVVGNLNRGMSHVDDVSDQDVQTAIQTGFTATTDPSCISTSNVVVVCVPTPLKKNGAPDMKAVRASAQEIRRHLRSGTLVILESTTYPGTTDGEFREILESSGLRAGADFSLAYSPERIDPGNVDFTLKNTPKIVGGYTKGCQVQAVNFYSTFIDSVVPVSGTREAELSKLLENTYRHINIALVNEMAIFCHELGINLWESIDAARSKPFGFHAFYPGPGVGGHCIPIDPNYLSHTVRELGYSFKFVELAQDISKRMPDYVVSRVQDLLNDAGLPMKESNILVIGLTYKPDIADDRETPAVPIIKGLLRRGAEVTVHDPYLDAFSVNNEACIFAKDVYSSASTADLVILLQNHKTYDYERLLTYSSIFFDTRGYLRDGRAFLL